MKSYLRDKLRQVQILLLFIFDYQAIWITDLKRWHEFSRVSSSANEMLIQLKFIKFLKTA